MRQQAQNRRLKDEDVRSLAEVGLLSAGIIHEVKNALQGIANALFLLDGEQDLRPKAREWIADARRELSRAIDVSRETLDVVRVGESNAIPVKITDLLEDVLSVYAGKIEYKHVIVERRYEFHEAIHADPVAVRQIFANIVLNALESTPNGQGKLIIHTQAWHAKSGKTGNENARGVRILFSDNGPGIPEQNKRRVFEPLFSTKKGKGTGLGLWMVKQLVHKQHGGLGLRSRNSRCSSGTCFSVFLPLHQN